MKKTVLITGASGMVAKNLSDLLQNEYSVKFLTRKKKNENEFEWNVAQHNIDIKAFENVDHIIHLAGAGIADKRWSKKRKRILASSRIDSAQLILKTLKENDIKIKSFISASAIGFYGSITSNSVFTENDNRGNDFLSNLCYNWEKIADKFTSEKIASRTVKIRIGIVLSAKGGALKKMMTPVKYYIGSPIGSGKQYMPWIHIDDLCEIFKYVLDNNKLNGTYNAVAPEHITNKLFTETIAKVFSRPLFLPSIPSFIIKLLFGETSVILLNGSRISSEKIMNSGYQFKFTNLKNTLINIF